ncbi:glycosyltransferase family 32 protein [Croceibacter atlanticus]|uniref:glycosyltransferase family 32 protein n=1 Tax=Croceibacter atlanticus TaxID=313588 RepID=UPI0030D79926|tara:strand:- start:88149 stop:88871 length:723 start_codon:yes stop_codon:yes gene_type:complete
MIPKVIHYCWFGGNPLPQLAIKCINSWRKYLPDYEIKEWNEKNFPLENYVFAKEALENRKFAFVSDVARLHALKYEGGVYMDTDVEVLKPLDNLLNQTAFSGFENDDFVPTGIMASVKNGDWVSELIDYYNNKPFVDQAGNLDTTTNTYIITQMMREKGFVMNNTYQEIKDYVAFYPSDFFCPKSYITGEINLSQNTYCIHHFAKSWISIKKRMRNNLKLKLMKTFGYKNIQRMFDIINR